ncbi:hypothetical protein FA13DRAFT_1735353 [Coprinellus micaceus]|uniref:Uncharacterized protein n=1 Tax=Coprinellus micaceus TaxID=71717 RepID=A0A4Y7T3T7_COPMI|nr:hypothetical protein FA13DRAFT_1735353 [Coprinellus micaceus]
MLTTLTRTLTSRLKPHRTEAIARIRFNACSLILVLVLTSIVPGIPSLPTAVGTTLVQRFGSGGKSGEDAEGLWAWLCFAESCVAAICLFNISESIYALKYPRSTPPTPASASRPPLGQTQGTPAKKKLFEGVSVSSPSSSPQPQRPFSFSSSLSSSGSPSSTPPYPLSPLSTPSRTLAYSSPLSSSSLNSSFASSTSTVGYTPSPQSRVGLSTSTSTGLNLGASYRGRAFGGSTARPLDGSYLGRIVKTDDDDDE